MHHTMNNYSGLNIESKIQETNMSSKTVTIPNISCEHCTRTIKMEVEEIEGVSSVQADEATKEVVIEWDDPANWDEIQDLLSEINYPPAS